MLLHFAFKRRLMRANRYIHKSLPLLALPSHCHSGIGLACVCLCLSSCLADFGMVSSSTPLKAQRCCCCCGYSWFKTERVHKRSSLRRPLLRPDRPFIETSLKKYGGRSDETFNEVIWVRVEAAFAGLNRLLLFNSEEVVLFPSKTNQF